MRYALFSLALILGCDRGELDCDEGQHALNGVCVPDVPPTVTYPDSGADDTAGADDTGGSDSAAAAP